MIRSLLPNERPRERCLSHGPRCLSLRECLAVLLGSGPAEAAGCMGVAQAIVEAVSGGMGDGASERAFFIALENGLGTDFQDIRGLGDAGRARLLAAFELARRYTAYRAAHARVLSPWVRVSDISRACLERIPIEARTEPREWLGFVPIYRSGEAGDFCLVEQGVRTHVNVEPAELFSRILRLRPRAFVLAHNHPSGDPTPSPSDLQLTESVRRISRDLDIQLGGHWVVTPTQESFIP